MATETPGLILVNEDELKELSGEYEKIRPFLLPNWSIIGVKADCYGQAIRSVWSKVRDSEWIGLVSDDLVPSTSNWDKQLISGLKGWNIVSSNDGWQNGQNGIPLRMHGAIVWSGELARAVGWIFPERLKHIYHDDVWETIGKETGCWQTRMDIMVKHLHEALEGKIGPTMDRNSALWKHDEARFKEWMEYEKDGVVAKVKALMDRHGVRQIKADFTGAKVLIATPSIDGKYESAFLVGLFDTMRSLRENGALSQFAEEKYTADIALARNKLLAAFLRTDCTHMLMIDADMGWNFDAVIRLFFAKKDVVAVAGPKKRYPLSFAANYTDVAGNPLNLTYDNETATMEVSEIGMAFCLITRQCAERMVQAYPELRYIGITGEPESALFNPMVAHQRFFSEDFAFCARWRAIGGQVFMAPDVPLSHVGSHTFKGAFSETIAPQPDMAEAAE